MMVTVVYRKAVSLFVVGSIVEQTTLCNVSLTRVWRRQRDLILAILERRPSLLGLLLSNEALRVETVSRHTLTKVLQHYYISRIRTWVDCGSVASWSTCGHQSYKCHWMVLALRSRQILSLFPI